MSRKKKFKRGFWLDLYASSLGGPEWVDDPTSGDTFYIHNDLFKEFFLGKDGGRNDLPDLLVNRKIEAYRAAEDSGDIIVDVKVVQNKERNRVEFAYVYGDVNE